MSAPAAIMVIIRTMAAVDECRRSLPGMGHDFFDDVVPLTIFLAPVAMWRSDWEWAMDFRCRNFSTEYLLMRASGARERRRVPRRAFGASPDALAGQVVTTTL